MTDLPAWSPPAPALKAITDMRDLLGQLKAGMWLVMVPPPENADASAEPTYRLRRGGADVFAVSSRIASKAIAEHRVAVVRKCHDGATLYNLTIKGREP